MSDQTTEKPNNRIPVERRFAGKVLVTGAAGHLGANLVHRLVAEGRDVRVLLREGSDNGAIEGLDVERVYGDLREPLACANAVGGCESVYHVAAKISTLYGRADEEREIFECNVLGTKHLLAAARRADVERIVVSGSFSAVGHHLDDPSRPADEAVPFYPFSRHLPYARSKVLVEHECLRAAVDGLDVVIATSCAVLGPHDHKPSRMGRTLIDHAHGRVWAYIPGGGFEFVAARDIVEGHVLAMRRGRSGQKYVFSTEFKSLDEIMAIFAEVTGRPRPRLRLPIPLMAGIAEVSHFVLTNFFPGVPQRLTPGAIRILRMQRHADLSKARTELGYQPTEIRTALYEAYEDFARRGLVPRRPQVQVVVDSLREAQARADSASAAQRRHAGAQSALRPGALA